MTNQEITALADDFRNLSYSTEKIANTISTFCGDVPASVVDATTIINLDLDQIVSIGGHEIKAKELLLLHKLLQETYPEEYL